MKPFAWYDCFNDIFYREEHSARIAEKGGNKVTPVYEAVNLPDRRFTTAVACLTGLASRISPDRFNDLYEDIQGGRKEAKVAVQLADALLEELEKE